MRVVSDYVIKKNGEEYTMTPYGQAIAEHLPELKLNSTGAKIYRYLQNGDRGEELVEHVANSFNIDPSDKEAITELSADIDEFIRYLMSHGIVSEDNRMPDEDPDSIFVIAQLPILYYGDVQCIDDKLRSFERDSLVLNRVDPIEGSEPLIIRVIPKRPRVLSTGEVLIRTEELMVSKDEENYYVIYHTYKTVREMHIDIQTGAATIYTMPQPLSSEVFFAIRTAFLLYAAGYGRYAIHSSSILYKDKVYAFSASAGTGKSTHTALWEKLYQTPVINGDLNLISIEDDGVYVHGMPWCGTSEIYDEKRYRLGGIVMLKRDEHDHIEKLSTADKARAVRLRLITPAWDEMMLYDNNSFAEELSELVPITELYCTPNDSAAVCAKEEIDRWDA